MITIFYYHKNKPKEALTKECCVDCLNTTITDLVKDGYVYLGYQ